MTPLESLVGWFWLGQSRKDTGWEHPMKEWKELVDNSAPLNGALNRRWAAAMTPKP